MGMEKAVEYLTNHWIELVGVAGVVIVFWDWYEKTKPCVDFDNTPIPGGGQAVGRLTALKEKGAPLPLGFIDTAKGVEVAFGKKPDHSYDFKKRISLDGKSIGPNQSFEKDCCIKGTPGKKIKTTIVEIDGMRGILLSMVD